MASSVDGLISGLDTTTIITQLMAIQAQPQSRLKTSLTSQKSAISALQGVNAKMAALQTAAQALQRATTWGAATASSSSGGVIATVVPGALGGSTTFSVTQLARAQSSVSTATFSSLSQASAVTDTSFEIHRGTGASATIIAIDPPADSSLQSLVNAINGTKDAGVRAAAVQVSPGEYRLQLTATATGAQNPFSLTGAGGVALSALSFTEISAAQDATLHVGDALSGFDINSPSNTIEGVLPGVTLKVTALASDVSVTVGQDQSSITAAVRSLVDAANAALSQISAVSAAGTVGTDGTRTGAGALSGDSQMRRLTDQILSIVSAGSAGTSMSSVGIELTREGTLTFDADRFTAALSTDSDAAKRLFTTATVGGTGFADVFAAFGQQVSSTTGTIADAISNRQDAVRELTDRIADWDVRLDARREALQRQYAALETALGSLKNQSSWLAGQLNSLSPRSDS